MSSPSAPIGLAATAIISGAVLLSWFANPASDAIVEYRLYRTPIFWFDPELIAVVTGTSYVDASSELLPTTRWYYFVVAVNQFGSSPPSTAASVTIPLPPPTPPVLLALSATVSIRQ